MSIIRFRGILALILLAATMLACGPFTAATPQPAETLNALYTVVAETLSAMSTQGVINAIQATPTATLSIPPTASPIPNFMTSTSVPTLTPVTRCDAADFVTDVTYPDGSVIGRGTTFIKTWRIKNIGTCAWTKSYNLVFVSGDQLGAKEAVKIPASIGPGKTVDISIQFTAPNKDGHYKGYWMLRNESGVLFGFGESGDSNIYVDVNVSGYTVTGYDLAANACNAAWKNSKKQLPCPGTEGADEGFVLFMNAPQMEDGKTRGTGLLTHPQKVNNGIISGKFPKIAIQTGDHFKAMIGCLNKANDCDLIFKLGYQIGSDPIQSLGEWHEIYEGGYYQIDIDLSFLSGQNVRFILTVASNGSAHEDYALWVNPQITRQSSKPPTATPPPPTATTGP